MRKSKINLKNFPLSQKILPLDYVLLVITSVLTLAIAGFVYRGGLNTLVVEIHGKDGAFLYPLSSATETLKIEGPLGITLVEIAGGKASIIESPCQNKTCISGGAISRNGQFAACLPNGVMVSVRGTQTNVDGLSW
jgi:hypothetical protein